MLAFVKNIMWHSRAEQKEGCTVEYKVREYKFAKNALNQDHEVQRLLHLKAKKFSQIALVYFFLLDVYGTDGFKLAGINTVFGGTFTFGLALCVMDEEIWCIWLPWILTS